ncbi:HNH endonuclease [Trichocoleus sp. ST-U2]
MVPLYRGGADAEFNLALACRSCNLRKGTRISGIDPESGTEVRLFNPRQDQWDDHFQVDSDSGTLVGKTPIARVTIACLEINSQAQVTARQLWIRLSLFP